MSSLKTNMQLPLEDWEGLSNHQLRQKLLERMVNSEADLKRFWSKVSKENEWLAGCWEWTASLNTHGYGQFVLHPYLRRIPFSAHRVSYFLAHKKLPQNIQVCHHCDNRKCCNPQHLFLGTHQDNVDDCVRKGRQTRTRGEAHGNAILTEEQVKQIRILNAVDKVRSVELSKRFKVSKSTICAIIYGNRWAHIPFQVEWL